ncbi:MAG: hypothetical protein R6U32_00675, partial [Candidatus Woesearchaeota archaeon]
MRKKMRITPLFIIQLLLKMTIWVFGGLVIYWLVLKITGHSPTSEAVIMIVMGALTALVCLNLSFTFNIMKDLGDIKRYIKESDKRFYAL